LFLTAPASAGTPSGPGDDVSIVLPDEPQPAPAPVPTKAGRWGLGVSLGDYMNAGIIPVPTFGLHIFYAVSPGIDIGAQLGFLTGSASGDNKAFDKATTFCLSPFAEFSFASQKDFSPFIKVALTYINYNFKEESGESRDDNATSVWASVGMTYNLSQSVNIAGGVRFLDIGLSGDSKITAFGLSSPFLELDFVF
jgi:hypothetical protein